MPYHQYAITIPASIRDALISRLVELGSLGIIEQDSGIIAYFPDTLSREALESELVIIQSLVEHQGRMTVAYSLLPDADWNEAWKKNFKPLDVGERFTILPTWERRREERFNIIIDPAMAFGTGHHETTRSCLVLMERYAKVVARRRFLDLGTGTGLLAIAASYLGFQEVIGVDIDPLAIEAAQKNMDLNGKSEQIVLIAGSAEDAGSDYDLIAANLISGALVHLAERITAMTRPGGVAILSGILKGQENEVQEAFDAAGMTFREKLVDGKWVSLVRGRLVSGS